MPRPLLSLHTPLLAAALFALPAAHAATADAAAQVSDFGWRLIDLDVNDGITPEVSFYQGSAFIHAVKYGVAGDFKSDLGMVRVDADEGYAEAQAGDGISRGQSHVASPQASAQTFSTSAYASSWYTLSPRTAIEFSALGHAEASTDAYPNASASAEASLSTQLRNADGSDLDSGYGYLKLTQGSDTQPFLARVESGADTAHGYWIYHTETTAVLAVPEPATYGMLLAGVGVLGALARRRQR